MDLDPVTHRVLRICGWFAPIAIAITFAGFLLSGVLPFPLGPDDSTADVVAFYSRGTHVVMGLAISSAGIAMIGVVIAGITFVLWQSEGKTPILTIIQMVAGTATVAFLTIPLLIMSVTAFRPDRPGELTVLLNDLSWLLFITPISPFIIQNVSIAAGILTSKNQLFPRWLGYFNLWVGFTFSFDIIPYAFHSGPMAWNGILIFWLALTSYSLWVLAMGFGILSATSKEATRDFAAKVAA